MYKLYNLLQIIIQNKGATMLMRSTLLFVGLALLLTGCASTTIFPKGNNNYSSTSTSSDQNYAEKDAIEKAHKQCMDQGKRLAVTNH